MNRNGRKVTKTVTRQKFSKEIFGDKCNIVDIDIVINQHANGSRTCCQGHGKNGNNRDCIFTRHGWKYYKQHMVTMDGPYPIRRRKTYCDTHKVWVDFFDKDFKLGQNDEWSDSLNNLLSGDNDGLAAVGKDGQFIWTKSCINFAWLSFVQWKQGSITRTVLKNQIKVRWKHKFSDLEYYKLQKILNKHGKNQVLEELVDAILPSYDTIQLLLEEIGLQVAIPLEQELKIAQARLGSRWYSYDMSFLNGIGICSTNGYTATHGTFTVKDQWKNLSVCDLVADAKENQLTIVPVLAKCVFESLKYGPDKDGGFFFASDRTKKDRNIIPLIFQELKETWNA